METSEKNIEVTVVFALPDKQIQISVVCRCGTRLFEALEISEINEHLKGYDNLEYGVYGFRQALDYQLHNGDRVEIYRQLILSPTETRRLRAKLRQSK